MQDLEQKLRDWLISFADGDISTDQIVTFLKQSHLESYRNGQKTLPRPASQNNSQRNGQSNGQPVLSEQPRKPQWRNQKRSAANTPSRN
jgi:hypothetical protein